MENAAGSDSFDAGSLSAVPAFVDHSAAAAAILPGRGEPLPLNARKPAWLRAKIPGGEAYQQTRDLIKVSRLHTVCESAQCPNLGECWSRKTATIMILGNVCTRGCGFCAVLTGRPTELDLDEPRRVAEALKVMNLRHAVITSVARDELKDGGASVWAATIRAVRKECPQTSIEVLIPDFRGRWHDLDTVLDAGPDILNHNMETVPRLHKIVRPQARYDRTLELLSRAGERGFVTKTGLMLGIGEDQQEIEQTLRDIVSVGVEILTLGQYLRPSAQHLPIHRWVEPAEFERWKEFGLSIGYKVVESGPLVRSSYHADEQSDGLVHGHGRE
ncbi:lipoyl synthase [Verrucomicrobia bacterium LW23]|nr:lipoyl synthase [Verrucomicrobia bacterium LW23]